MCAFLVFAAVITAQPLVNPDILEPSVANEAGHALDRAPVVHWRGGVPFATNGLTATAMAIRLVSTQRQDGRWSEDGRDVTGEASALLRFLVDGAAECPCRLAGRRYRLTRSENDRRAWQAAMAAEGVAPASAGEDRVEGRSGGDAVDARAADLRRVDK